MTRKVFIADITSAAERKIPGITTVVRGDDDGDVNFCFVPASGAPIEIGLLATDVPGYPSLNTFMIFTRSTEVPNGVNEALEQFAPSSVGMRIPDLISIISQKLQNVLATGTRENPFGVQDGSDVEMLDELGEEFGDEFNDGFSDDGFGFSANDLERTSNTTEYSLSPGKAAEINRRIKEDLRAVKFAGFKLGILSGMKAESQTSIVSISIQVTKLGLSEEAMQAWDLEPQQYIVVLLRYSGGYKTFESIISEPSKTDDVAFRIGVSNKYRPTLVEAHAAFTDSAKGGRNASEDGRINGTGHEGAITSGFSSLFISSSLNAFINDQFICLLKIRNSMDIGWDGAKRYLNDGQGRLTEKLAEPAPSYFEESKLKQSTLPDLVFADHLADKKDKNISFPLIAAQFSMRYLVRCTEFCLVCHDKIEGEFEALKPYVCDKPLCLYQYMSLGFGPSVEHEILTQPFVVDLLVSFCYASAICRRLREYPTGMSLAVPPVAGSVAQTKTSAQPFSHRHASTRPATENTLDLTSKPLDIKFDRNRHEVLFESGQTCPIRGGDWVVITIGASVQEKGILNGGQSFLHYRVADISLYPTIKLSETAVPRTSPANSPGLVSADTAMVPATPATTPPPPALILAKMTIYDQKFDDMDDSSKGDTIVMLLETLPSIKELRSYLIQQSRFSEPSLRTWNDRVSPAALGILRWIIASNRSCLIQVDKCPGQDEIDLAMAKIRLDQKVGNVSDRWVQFRFAQGAPDKEQRFLNALRMEQAKLDPKYPTLFAFHGSPLANWHSIIRHGLDFKDTLHGRAFGNGVYHSQDQNVSVAYAHNSASVWPGSELKVQSAMSLNEIVNCPQQYQSATPYLVVQQIDWIQCRYLFVRTQDGDFMNSAKPDAASSSISTGIEQDPKYTAQSTLHKPIAVPQCAISVSRAFRISSNTEPPANKRRKNSSSVDKLLIEDNGIASDSDELEDITFLLSEDEELVFKGKAKSEDKPVTLSSKSQRISNPQTDFIPGALDQSSLPILDPPSYATPSATLRLNRELKTVLEIQNSTPLHELGWYIDASLVNNVYQWIVELHSFESILPLAKDMKDAGLTSVVLEIRFGKDFPHSPPFVRVVRPRFLPFMAGGGGHVTGGGAMCLELLTNSGWSAVSSIESILLQVRMAIMNLEPKPARLECKGKQHQRDYTTSEAMEAFVRACKAHGWEIPKDFQDFAGKVPGGY